MLSIIKRDFLNLFINPALALYATVFPVLLISVMSILNQGMFDTDVITSYEYYTMTLTIFMAFNMAIISTNAFMEISIKNSNLRIGYSPVSPWQIFTSKIIATFLFSLVMIVIIFVFMFFVFSVNFLSHMYVILPLILLTSLFACSLGVMCVILLKHEETANQFLGLLLILIALLGGVFFQPSLISDTFESLSVLSPMRWVIETIFLALFDDDLRLIVPTISAMILSIGVFVLISKRYFKLEDYL